MMFISIKTIITAICLTMPMLAAASPTGSTTPPTTGTGCQNSGGSVQCCNQVQTGSAALLGLFNGIPLTAILGIPVGLTCTPITVVGAGTNSCNQQSVCCTGAMSGVNVLNCTPVNVAL
ncbi:hypothetical protein BDQ12DRAFT_669756 [Crucibulum laeve]|uniref:Hydrophobin n=1 Tax=Crucibulum laeve TaxID=68775 RepID=A0A5C3LMX6_9AGAR|nr:hypothetical protein BDQ12DRAFT_669756 [Crucibulum laeve]